MTRSVYLSLATALLAGVMQAQTPPPAPQPESQAPRKPRAGTIIENPNAGHIIEAPKPPATTPRVAGPAKAAPGHHHRDPECGPHHRGSEAPRHGGALGASMM